MSWLVTQWKTSFAKLRLITSLSTKGWEPGKKSTVRTRGRETIKSLIVCGFIPTIWKQMGISADATYGWLGEGINSLRAEKHKNFLA